jgi:hypothetical protein
MIRFLFLAVTLLPAVVYAEDASQTNNTAKDMLTRAGIPRATVEAQDAWERCTDAAIDRFAAQPEPAREVAEAALAACVPEEIAYAQEGARDPIMQRVGVNLAGLQDAIEKTAMPGLLARIMALRAVRQGGSAR